MEIQKFDIGELINHEILEFVNPEIQNSGNSEDISETVAPPEKETVTTPRKKKLGRKIRNLQTKLCRVNKKVKTFGSGGKGHNRKKDIAMVCEKLDRLLPKETSKFVKSQIIANQRKSSVGNRWTLHDKMFALSIFYHSRKAYRLLKNLFILPSKSTLITLLGKSKIYPGLHDNIFEALQKRVSKFDDKDKQCVLIFDEMATKSSLSYNTYTDSIEGLEDFGCAGQSKFMANHALAFMVRGLCQKWKQCIGYFLTSGPINASSLQDLTLQAIYKLSKIGLHVRVLVCDQGSNNRRFVETLAGPRVVG